MNKAENSIVVRDNTNTGKLSVVTLGLLATLSTSLTAHGIDNQTSEVDFSKNKHITSPRINETSISRILEYTSEQYSMKGHELFNPINTEMDLRLLELTQELVKTQKILDEDIQKALEDFSKINGDLIPKKNRF